MKFFWPTHGFIESLEGRVELDKAKVSGSDRRRSLSVCVIDDQPFSPLQNLRNNHFQISEVADPKDIRTLEPYAIILCDLQGVGTALNPQRQGAHLIAEIKSNYPDKIVIGYTGAIASSIIYKDANQNADYMIKKDAPIEDWISTLDGAIDQLRNPIIVWKKFRARLIEKDVPLYKIAELEDTFVKTYSKGSDTTGARLISCINRLDLGQDIRPIIQGFVSSVIFKMVFG